MRKIFFYFLVLLFAVWLGVVMYTNSGYVLLSYKNTVIETSLWFAIIALLAAFVLFYMLLRIGSGIGAVAGYFGRWFSNRQKKKAHKRTVLGLYNLIEGDWARAEKNLFNSARHSDMPIVNYLAASFVVKNQERRNNYLRLAQKAAKDRPLISGLAQASLQIDSKQLEAAAVTLQNLYKLKPKSVFVLQLLQQVYFELNDWYGLEKLLPDLRKQKVLSEESIDQLEIKVYQELLLVEAKNKNIIVVWKKLPHYLQKVPVLVAVYIEYLLADGQDEEAEDILKMILRKNLDPKLLKLYAELSSKDQIKQLMRAEEWLEDNPDSADLYLCLGRLCHQQKLWGKAINYLEKSIKIDPIGTAYIELAKIMTEQGDIESALVFYTNAIKFN